jgi:hypothetical protein
MGAAQGRTLLRRRSESTRPRRVPMAGIALLSKWAHDRLHSNAKSCRKNRAADSAARSPSPNRDRLVLRGSRDQRSHLRRPNTRCQIISRRGGEQTIVVRALPLSGDVVEIRMMASRPYGRILPDAGSGSHISCRRNILAVCELRGRVLINNERSSWIWAEMAMSEPSGMACLTNLRSTTLPRISQSKCWPNCARR